MRSRRLMSGDLLLVSFRIDGERCAIELDAVERVLRAVALTPLPGAPPAIRGVFSLHGDIVAVADLRRRFGLPGRDLSIDDQIVVARLPSRRIGVLTEGATEVLHCAEQDIERRAELLQGAPTIAGIARMPSGLILIHDLARLLSRADERTLDELLDELLDGPLADRPA